MTPPARSRPPTAGTAPGNDFGMLAGPLHLPSLTPAEHTQLMTGLRPWVAQLVTRFHIDTRVIPPCWARHTGMVEALAALRDLERDCYHDQARPCAGVDFFRGYREIEARLTEIASLTCCTAREHRDPPAGWPLTHPAPEQDVPAPGPPAGGAPVGGVT